MICTALKFPKCLKEHIRRGICNAPMRDMSKSWGDRPVPLQLRRPLGRKNSQRYNPVAPRIYSLI